MSSASAHPAATPPVAARARSQLLPVLAARRLGRVVVCALLCWAGLLTIPSTAGATSCSDGTGVSVVVDFGSFGGTQTGCAGAPPTGLAALSQAGFSVVQVTTQPGFVCRIDGVPPAQDDACVRTPPTTAYWSYWTAAPGARSWSYSTQGAASTHPEQGASEGWAFGAGSPPAAAPPVNTAPPPPPPPPSRSTPPAPPPAPSTSAGTTRPPPAPTTTRADPTSLGSPPSDGSSRSGAPPPPPATGAGSSAPGGTATRTGGTATSAAGTSAAGSSAPASSTAAGAAPTARTDATAVARSTDSSSGPAGGTPWGLLGAGLLAAALAGGAVWQIRARR